MFTTVYLSTRGFIALTPAFNFPVRPFNLATCAFCFLTRTFSAFKNPLSGTEKCRCFTWFGTCLRF